MRYLIAHLIKGEAGAYHIALSDDIARRHRLAPTSVRIPPHFTLKAPFEMSDMAPIEEILAAFAADEHPEPYLLGGFGEFDGRVIYLAASAPKQTHMLLRRLQDRLRAVPWMTFKRTEFPLTLHATLVYAKSKEQTVEILSGLREHRTFESSLDAVALLRNDSDRWQVLREYPLSGK